VLATVVVGVFAYQAGLAQGAASAAAAAGTLPPYAYAWGWHRPWGFGFGFPLLFILFFWFVLLRGLFWGPWHRRRWYYYGDVPQTFDDWHRRAHERMSSDAPKS
jgi:hypothetical protein